MKMLVLATLLFLLLVDARGVGMVVPNDNALAEGGYNNAFPFDEMNASVHYQQIYDASQFKLLGTNGGTITSIGFRYGYWYSMASIKYSSMTVTLSTTTKSVDNLSSTFSDNIGPDHLAVFSRDYSIGVSSPPSDGQMRPWPFPMVIPLTHPFYYNPTNGNLLLDIKWPNARVVVCCGSPDEDAVYVSGDSVSRVFGINYFQTYIPTNGTADTIGLVTMFGIAPAIAPSPKINNVGLSGTNMLACGGGGAPGTVFYMLTTTNLASPLTEWSFVNMNTPDANGHVTLTNGISADIPQQFYILQLQ
jgi:hypothetical protein